MNNKHEQFYKEIGIDNLPEDKKEEFSIKLEELFEKFFTLALADKLSQSEVDAIEKMKTAEEMASFLSDKGIDYQQIGLEVAAEIKGFIQEQMTYLQGYIDATIDKN